MHEIVIVAMKFSFFLYSKPLLDEQTSFKWQHTCWRIKYLKKCNFKSSVPKEKTKLIVTVSYLKLSITFTKHKCEKFNLCLKIGRQVLLSKQNWFHYILEGLRPVSLKYAHAQPQSNQEAITDAFYLASRLSKESKHSTKPESAQHFSSLVFSIRKLSTPAMETLWQKIHNEEDPKMQ